MIRAGIVCALALVILGAGVAPLLVWVARYGGEDTTTPSNTTTTPPLQSYPNVFLPALPGPVQLYVGHDPALAPARTLDRLYALGGFGFDADVEDVLDVRDDDACRVRTTGARRVAAACAAASASHEEGDDEVVTRTVRLQGGTWRVAQRAARVRAEMHVQGSAVVALRGAHDRLVRDSDGLCTTYEPRPERRVCDFYVRTDAKGEIVRPVRAFRLHNHSGDDDVEVRRFDLFVNGAHASAQERAWLLGDNALRLLATNETCTVVSEAPHVAIQRIVRRSYTLDQLDGMPLLVLNASGGEDDYYHARWNRALQTFELLRAHGEWVTPRPIVPQPLTAPRGDSGVFDDPSPLAPQLRARALDTGVEGGIVRLYVLQYDPQNVHGGTVVELEALADHRAPPQGARFAWFQPPNLQSTLEPLVYVDGYVLFATPYDNGDGSYALTGDRFMRDDASGALYRIVQPQDGLGAGPYALACGDNVTYVTTHDDVYEWVDANATTRLSTLSPFRAGGLPYECGGTVAPTLDPHACGPADAQDAPLLATVLAPEGYVYSLTAEANHTVRCAAYDHWQRTATDCDVGNDDNLTLPALLPFASPSVAPPPTYSSAWAVAQSHLQGTAATRRLSEEDVVPLNAFVRLLRVLLDAPPPPPPPQGGRDTLDRVVLLVSVGVGGVALVLVVYLLANPQRVEGVVKVIRALSRAWRGKEVDIEDA